MNGQATMSKTQLTKIFGLEAAYEFLNVLRTPAFAIPTLAFPLMFYLFFGVVMGSARGHADFATYLVATYGTFGIIGPALFGFGVGLATERDQGWLLLKRVSPMPSLSYFTAKMAMSAIFAFLIVVLLFAMAATLGEVSLRTGQWLSLGAILVAGTLPFCAMGLAIGAWSQAKAAVAIVNLVYLPMAFLSGLWLPIRALPEMLQGLAFIFPPYHLSQIALAVLDMDQGGNRLNHVGVLLLVTVLFLWLARMGFQRRSGS